MNVKNKIRLFNNLIINHSVQARHNEDIYCLQLISKYLNQGNFIPMTSMALRPFVLSFVLNEIAINDRKNIIEFGAGISTILMARMAKDLNKDITIVTVEENEEWCKLIQEMLMKEGLQDYVSIIHASVEPRVVNNAKNHWYNQEKLQNALVNRLFDLVLIDGPTAFNDSIALSRYFAMPFLKNLLSDNHVVFLDDANRRGEKQVMHLWEQEFNKSFNIYATTLGIHYKGEHFECNPMKSIPIE